MVKGYKYSIIFHLIFWVIWAWIFSKVTIIDGSIEIDKTIISPGNIIVENIIEQPLNTLLVNSIGVFFKMLFSYFVILWLHGAFFEKSKNKFILIGILGIIITYTLEYTADYFYMAFEYEVYKVYLSIWAKLNLIQYGLLLSIISLYIFIKEWMFLDKKVLLLEKDKLHSELAFLKYQINPHFLFNTLNNLYSISQEHDVPEVSDSILKLSNLLRYMLYENKEKEILIAKEIEFIEQFIELQKLRLFEDNMLHVSFDIEGSTAGVLVKPFLLIPFVENAFKHGVDLQEDSSIEINLKIGEEKVFYSVRNQIFRNYTSLTKEEGGIGIKNLEKRMELLYPNKHELIIVEEDGYYMATLIFDK